MLAPPGVLAPPPMGNPGSAPVGPDVKQTLTVLLLTYFAVTVNSFLQNLMLKLFCFRGNILKHLPMEDIFTNLKSNQSTMIFLFLLRMITNDGT